MQSSLISKIEKARIYAEEPERFQVQSLKVLVRGDSTVHAAEFGPNGWSCDCYFFQDTGTCSHTMALERMIGDILPDGYRTGVSG